jgi:hypothetical protein
MISMNFRRALAFVIVLSVSGSIAATALAANPSRPGGVLQLPVTGTLTDGGFAGTASINRFEQRGNAIVAIGFVSGTLTRGGQVVGTVLAGEVTWPVTVRSGGALGANARTAAVTAQATCPVLNVALGPVDVNLLGADVSLSAVTLAIVGEQGTPLGDLVCAISNLLGNVAAVVNLLNSLLGLVTGLLGGIIPGA